MINHPGIFLFFYFILLLSLVMVNLSEYCDFAYCLTLLLSQIDAIQRKESMKVMTETFYAALFGYDEVRC